MTSTDNQLVTMANQIAKFFESQPGNVQLVGVKDHINRFWEKRMRQKLVALAHTDEGNRLHNLVRQVISDIKVT